MEQDPQGDRVKNVRIMIPLQNRVLAFSFSVSTKDALGILSLLLEFLAERLQRQKIIVVSYRRQEKLYLCRTFL